METTEKRLAPVSFESLKRGDVIYIEDSPTADPWQIRDLGQPFILIENMNTYFSYCYRVVKPIYKLI